MGTHQASVLQDDLNPFCHGLCCWARSFRHAEQPRETHGVLSMCLGQVSPLEEDAQIEVAC